MDDAKNLDKLAELIETAENHLLQGKGQEALDCAQQALELNAESHSAFLIKMRAMEFVGTIEDDKCSDVFVCGGKAIQYAPEGETESVKKQVYHFFLRRAYALIEQALDLTEDTEELMDRIREGDESPSWLVRVDEETRYAFEKLAFSGYLLTKHVAESKTELDVDMRDLLAKIAKTYIAFCEADENRVSDYGVNLAYGLVRSRRMCGAFLVSLLDQAQKDEIESSIYKTAKRGLF